MSLPLIALVGVGYLAHTTGYDKKALERAKTEYRAAKLRVADLRYRWAHRNDPKKVTELGATGPVPPQV